MIRYQVIFYNQPPLNTFSIQDNNITDRHWSKKYIQLLGFAKEPHSTHFYSFYDLLNYDPLPKIKGMRPILMERGGRIRVLTATIKDIIKEPL